MTLAKPFNAAMEAIGYFESRPTLAVAVSGGPDSMALLLLAQEWSQLRGGKVIALTVDHHLRPESAVEAKQVAAWCAARKIAHHILNWHPDSTVGIQEAARAGRYDELTRWCKAHHVLHLLTGHHEGDQAETLFFRLARGSGVSGLACMAPVSEYQGIRIVRPLLSFSKSSLCDYLNAAEQDWISDPSNDKPDYTRNRIRTQLQSQETMADAANLAARLGHVRHVAETEMSRQMTRAFSLFEGGYGFIEHKTLAAMEQELAEKALATFLQTVSGEPYAARSEKITRLLSELTTNSPRTRNFSGCLLRWQEKQQRFLVHREAKAVAAPLLLQPGETQLWDQRFAVSFTGDVKSIEVKALGNPGRKLLKSLAKPSDLRHIPAPALSLLPSFWRLEELVSVPHIGYRHPAAGLICKARFRPAKALAGSAFWSKNKLKGT